MVVTIAPYPDSSAWYFNNIQQRCVIYCHHRHIRRHIRRCRCRHILQRRHHHTLLRRHLYMDYEVG